MKTIQLLTDDDGEDYILDGDTGEYIHPVVESPHEAFLTVCNDGGMDCCDNVDCIPDDEDADSFFDGAQIVEEKLI